MSDNYDYSPWLRQLADIAESHNKGLIKPCPKALRRAADALEQSQNLTKQLGAERDVLLEVLHENGIQVDLKVVVAAASQLLAGESAPCEHTRAPNGRLNSVCKKCGHRTTLVDRGNAQSVEDSE